MTRKKNLLILVSVLKVWDNSLKKMSLKHQKKIEISHHILDHIVNNSCQLGAIKEYMGQLFEVEANMPLHRINFIINTELKSYTNKHVTVTVGPMGLIV